MTSSSWFKPTVGGFHLEGEYATLTVRADKGESKQKSLPKW